MSMWLAFWAMAVVAATGQGSMPAAQAPAEDFSSLARVFPRVVDHGHVTVRPDWHASAIVQSGARVKAPALEWRFLLKRRVPPWPPGQKREREATALAICRPALTAPATVSFWLKNPFGHGLSIELRAVSSTGMVVGWPARDVSNARKWTELSWPARDARIIEAPPASEPLPIQEWHIVVSGKPDKQYRIFLDEFSVRPAPPANIRVRRIALPARQVRAGERMTVAASIAAPEATAFDDIRVELRDKSRAVAWAPVPLAAAHRGTSTHIRLAVPATLSPGSYSVAVTSNRTQVAKGQAPVQVTVLSAHTSMVKIFRSQFPSGVIYYRPEFAPPQERAPVVRVRLTCNYDLVGDAPDVVMPGGSTSFAGVDAALNRIVQYNPHARMLVEIYVGATPEWLAANPTEATKFNLPLLEEASGRARNVPSLASSVWLNSAASDLKRLIGHIESSPWGKQVVGYLISSGAYNEWRWDWPGVCGGQRPCLPDYSPAAARAFRAFLQRRYGQIENLRVAWGQPRRPVLELAQKLPAGEPRPVLSWADVKIPDPARRLAQPLSLLEPPAFNDVVDFRLFLAHASEAAAVAMAEAAKAAAGAKPVGVRVAFWNRTLNLCPDLSVDEVLASDAVSFVVGHRPGPDCLPFSMVHRAGKKAVADLSGLRNSITGGAVKAAAERGADAVMVSWAPERAELQQMTQSQPRPRSNATVAVVVDPESAATVAADCAEGELSPLFQLWKLFRFHRVHGPLPYEIWSMHEITDRRLRDRRVILFANAYRLAQETRDAIDALKARGHLLIFTYAAGAMRPLRGLNGRDMRALTGLAIVPVKGGHQLDVRITSGIDPWTAALKEDTSVLLQGRFDPWFCVIDNRADALGFLSGPKRLVSVAARDFGQWKVVYSAAPRLPGALVHALLALASR